MAEDINGLKRDYPGLDVTAGENGSLVAKGKLAFSATFPEKANIQDEFEVEIFFPAPGSAEVPTAKETGRRIENFHVNPDGTLCLATLVEIRRKRLQDPSLRGYIEDLVIPFLYSFSYKSKFGELPFGELSHGGEGIFEYYKEYFQTSSEMTVLQFLKILVQNNYKGHILCPCGSEARIRSCHGKRLLELKAYQTRKDFLVDFANCLGIYTSSHQSLPRGFFSNGLKSYWNRHLS